MYWFYYEIHNLGVSDCCITELHKYLKAKNIPSSLVTVKTADEFSMNDFATQDDIFESIYFYYQGE